MYAQGFCVNNQPGDSLHNDFIGLYKEHLGFLLGEGKSDLCQ